MHVQVGFVVVISLQSSPCVCHLKTAAYLGLLSQMFDWIIFSCWVSRVVGFFNVQYLLNLLCFVKYDEIYGVSDFFPPLKTTSVSQIPDQLLWLTHCQ